ncbi:GmrSD restriction endonuclease domain-containing protein, partial [Luteimonas changyuni]|uniref:GmrSD restriction endonuclease domain-containing protein n=1 Tax=Luteimonas sp. MJ145 TaxID=3129234 RepID=UPI0031BB5BF3
IRGKSLAGLESYVRTAWPTYVAVIPNLEAMSYQKSDRSNLLYILARISCFLEDSFAATSRVGFETYWRRDKGGKTFDIEHLLMKKFEITKLPATHGFVDEREYLEMRNKIGALALLPRSRNRSLQDTSYREKLSSYATEGAITQTLDSGIYKSNPNVASFLASAPTVKLAPVPDFAKADIAARAAVYVELSKLIWQSP